MAARAQRLFLLSLVCVALLTTVTVARLGWPWLAGPAGLGVIGSFALVLAAELICLFFVEKSALRPAIGDLWVSWFGEVIAAAPVFCWRQPFRPCAEPDRLPQQPDGHRGVLLVHGLICNRGFWTPWMRRLRLLGVPFLAVDLEPVFATIEVYAATIERAVSRLHSATGMPPVIVAHSMGGLAVRHWLRDSGGAGRVHRIVTLGTPHQGTWLARFGMSQSAGQMSVGSEWLRRLAASEEKEGYGRFTCFYGACDNVVFPSANATLPGADNRRIERTGHVALAFRQDVLAEVLRWLDPRHGELGP